MLSIGLRYHYQLRYDSHNFLKKLALHWECNYRNYIMLAATIKPCAAPEYFQKPDPRENLAFVDSGKDGQKSAEHRTAGNNHFKRKEDEHALDEYNRAVLLGAREDQTLRKLMKKTSY